MQTNREENFIYNSRMQQLINELCKLKLSRIFCVFVMVFCPSKAHCIPGTEWQITNSVNLQEDEGANTYTTAYINVSYVDPNTKRFYIEKSEIGKYGDGRIGPAEGVLVHVSSENGDHTGCTTPILSTWGNGSLPKEPWIALIKRGQCSFEVKIANAYKHNATAVLVYNDRDSPVLDKMKLNSLASGTRNMSAIFTYKWKGEQLAKLVDNGSRVIMHITVATRCTRSNVHVNRTSVLFVSISFVVLMLISMAWLVFYYVQRFRYMHAKERLSKRLCNAAKKALSKIPTKEIQQEDKEVQGDGECCAVCIEPYKVTDDLRILPCSHEFHKSCIDPWLLEHRTCPMCKMDILKYYGFVFSNSQESFLEIEVERNVSVPASERVTMNDSHSGLSNESRVQTAPSDCIVIPIENDSGELAEEFLEVCEHCIKCRCKGKGTNIKKTGEDCCLIDRSTEESPDPDTAQLLLNHKLYESLNSEQDAYSDNTKCPQQQETIEADSHEIPISSQTGSFIFTHCSEICQNEDEQRDQISSE